MIEKGVWKVEWHCGSATESIDENATLVQFFTLIVLPESLANQLCETGRLPAGRFTQGQWNAMRRLLRRRRGLATAEDCVAQELV